MEPTKDIAEVVQGWAEIVEDRFREGLDDYEIGKLDGDLWRSFVFEVIQANGNVDAVVFKFLKYGRFVDMGVGRGVPIGARGSASFEKARKQNGQLNRYGRKHKPWYSRTKTREIAILRQILIQDYGINSLNELESSFNTTEILPTAA